MKRGDGVEFPAPDQLASAREADTEHFQVVLPDRIADAMDNDWPAPWQWSSTISLADPKGHSLVTFWRPGRRRATPERPAGEAEPSGLDAENRELAARFWVHYRCGYVGCQTVEQHEHGGGPPMRAMTPDERIAARLTPERPAEEAGG